MKAELTIENFWWLSIAQFIMKELVLFFHFPSLLLKSFLDQYQYLGNCPPTPPLTQQESIDNKLGLMLG